MRHPEDDLGEEHFDWAAHRRNNYVNAYRFFRKTALDLKDAGKEHEGDTSVFTDEASFNEFVAARVENGTPSEFVAVAEEVAAELSKRASERSAQARGYSCAMEESLEWEAAEERRSHVA